MFAGLVGHWSGLDGDLAACAIVTAEANELMRPIHDQMPVILGPDGVDTWLDPDNRHAEALLKPYSAEAMEMWVVWATVCTTPGNVSPELVEPIRPL